ncbi:MAG: hypothetical protein J6U64_06100 [Alphaproteobacteria bacterium]|nr:hypothetical protein [Alphaproteobacteria bacterium]
MTSFHKIATKSLNEIQQAEERYNALCEKKAWIEQVQKNPQSAAPYYFEIFDNLVKNSGNNHDDWEKLALLLYLGPNPLVVKNENGQNPFEYFFERNREVRHSLNETSEKIHFLSHQRDRRLLFTANTLAHALEDFGLSKEQLKPLHKVQMLWISYERLMNKEKNTRRVGFSRLLKTVARHPEDALCVSDFKKTVEQRLKQEERDEKQAYKKWRKEAKTDYRAEINAPSIGNIRKNSPFHNKHQSNDYFLYQPLPSSSQKALDDFLLTLKDIDASWRNALKIENVLPPKKIKAYQRALYSKKRSENTR